MCPDINECLTANDCQQECVNTEGNYKCGCNQGFTLNTDNTSCDGISALNIRPVMRDHMNYVYLYIDSCCGMS